MGREARLPRTSANETYRQSKKQTATTVMSLATLRQMLWKHYILKESK